MLPALGEEFPRFFQVVRRNHEIESRVQSALDLPVGFAGDNCGDALRCQVTLYFDETNVVTHDDGFQLLVCQQRRHSLG